MCDYECFIVGSLRNHNLKSFWDNIYFSSQQFSCQWFMNNRNSFLVESLLAKTIFSALKRRLKRLVWIRKAIYQPSYKHLRYYFMSNIELLNEWVWSNTIYTTSRASCINLFIHRSRRLSWIKLSFQQGRSPSWKLVVTLHSWVWVT